MRTVHTPASEAATFEKVMVESDVVTHAIARRALAALRIAFGLTFLWAFFDKLLALGYATGVDAQTGNTDRFGPAAWIHGGSPTFGFLKFGVADDNPFAGTFHSMAGQGWADWLFMLGLLGVGITLTLGVGMRLGAITGGLLYLLMWVASMPLDNNPVIDDHVIGLISMIVLAVTLAGDTWGAGKIWARTHLVGRFPILR
jgi:thiosulfate dehydrogenase [quinone] large subunit